MDGAYWQDVLDACDEAWIRAQIVMAELDPDCSREEMINYKGGEGAKEFILQPILQRVEMKLEEESGELG